MDIKKVIKDLKSSTYHDIKVAVDLAWVYANEFLELEEIAEEISEDEFIDMILKYSEDDFYPFKAYKFIYKGEVDPINIIAASELDPNIIKQHLEDESEYNIEFEEIKPQEDEELIEVNEDYNNNFNVNDLSPADRQNRELLKQYIDKLLDNTILIDDSDHIVDYVWDEIWDNFNDIFDPETIDWSKVPTWPKTPQNEGDYLRMIGWGGPQVEEYVYNFYLPNRDKNIDLVETIAGKIKPEQEELLKKIKSQLSKPQYTYYATRVDGKKVKQPILYNEVRANGRTIKFEYNCDNIIGSEKIKDAFEEVSELIEKMHMSDTVTCKLGYARAPYIRVTFINVDSKEYPYDSEATDLVETKKKKRKKEFNMSLYPVLGVGGPLFGNNKKEDNKEETIETAVADSTEAIDSSTEISASVGEASGDAGAAMGESVNKTPLKAYTLMNEISRGSGLDPIIADLGDFDTIDEARDAALVNPEATNWFIVDNKSGDVVDEGQSENTLIDDEDDYMYTKWYNSGSYNGSVVHHGQSLADAFYAATAKLHCFNTLEDNYSVFIDTDLNTEQYIVPYPKECLFMDRLDAETNWAELDAKDKATQKILDFIKQNTTIKDVDLVEDIEKHDTLNPALWNEDKTLKTEVREAILNIVQKFVENLNEDGVQINVGDIVLLGSNASYNYTKDSDIDIHILADEKFDCSEKHLQIIYNAYRSLFNNKYNITINGFEVELYVEDIDKMSAISNGIFSVKQDKWLKEPTKLTIPDLDQEAFAKEFKKWEDKYFSIINEEDSLTEGFRKGEVTLSQIVYQAMQSLDEANVLSLGAVKKIVNAEEIEASDDDIKGIYDKFIHMFEGEKS